MGFKKWKDEHYFHIQDEGENLSSSRSSEAAEAGIVLAHLGNSRKWALPEVEGSHEVE